MHFMSLPRKSPKRKLAANLKMLDINQVLMRRVKPSPGKRKLSAQKKVTAASKSTTTVRGLFNVSRPLEERSEPAKERKHTSPVSKPASSLYESPQVTAPIRQAYIDLGQKDFGRHVTCRKCGLLYTAGEEEDEKEHRRFCRDRQRGIKMPKWKNERMLKTFADGGDRIIEIRADDASLHVKKLMEVKEVLDDALGYVEEDVFLKRGHFLFVHAKQIVGCVTVERITKAIVLDKATKSSSSGEPVTISPTESSKVPAVLGICQLWVHPQHRGKKIATRLVDAVREKFIYGLLIAKHRIAFAQPTRNGLAFATSYVTPHHVLVYEDAEPTSSAIVSNSMSSSVTTVKRTLLP